VDVLLQRRRMDLHPVPPDLCTLEV
jgi:hypothetical protein